MHITPNGRYLGRLPDRGHKHLQPRFMHVHRAAMAKPYPRKIDLASKFPAPFDQGQLGSCGPNSGIGLLAYYDSGFMGSRLQLYYEVRQKEGTIGEDSGVETQDVIERLCSVGVGPESDWPYDISKFTDAPPPMPASEIRKLTGKPARIMSALEAIQALANNAPFIVGFEVPQNLESEQVARTGIVPWYDIAEPTVGGHDVVAVGYDLDFPSSDVVQKAGADPSTAPRHALKIRNSWSAQWGDAGHFWIDLRYMVDQSTGNDLWTAH